MSYCGYPYYWGGLGMWGEGLYPTALFPGAAGCGADPAQRARDEGAHRHAEHAGHRAERERHRYDDPHLRSCNAVVGYHLHAVDGEIGHVSGLLVDDETWAIRYLVVDTSNGWLGHEVLVAPQWTTGVHWDDRTVSADLSRELIQQAPPYDPSVVWSRDHDLSLYQHHRRTGFKAGGALLETEM